MFSFIIYCTLWPPHRVPYEFLDWKEGKSFQGMNLLRQERRRRGRKRRIKWWWRRHPEEVCLKDSLENQEFASGDSSEWDTDSGNENDDEKGSRKEQVKHKTFASCNCLHNFMARWEEKNFLRVKTRNKFFISQQKILTNNLLDFLLILSFWFICA